MGWIIKEVVERDVHSFLDGNDVDSVIDWLQAMKVRFEGKGLEFYVDYNYSNTDVHLMAVREETEMEEYEREQSTKALTEIRERALLKELQKKYGN